MEKINSVFCNIQPKIVWKKIKNKDEEIKELIQNPSDPLTKFPLRGLGYSNEVGAALSAMPGWGKTAEVLLWIPALMYLGADIFDKYSRGKEGNYSAASVTTALEEATFQALASVILPTAAVKIGQNLTGYFKKFDGSNLTATAQEELYRKLIEDFDKDKFTKMNFDRVKAKVLDEGFEQHLNETKHALSVESFGSKIIRFFGHTTKPVASAKTNRTKVTEFVEKQAKKFYDIQAILESGDEIEISKLGKNTLKYYKKSGLHIDEKAAKLIDNNPALVLKKLLNTQNPAYQKYAQQILENFQGKDIRLNLKVLIKDKKASSEMLKSLMDMPGAKQEVFDFVRVVSRSTETVRKLIKLNEMKLGWLKTIGGFISLGCLAIPIDNFVHKFIISKFVKPGLENIENIKLSFKKDIHN